MRCVGVGVAIENGSELLEMLLNDDSERDMDDDFIEFEGEGRSSMAGGGMPNSVCNQSI